MIPRARRALAAALLLLPAAAAAEAPPVSWSHDLSVTLDPGSGSLRVADRVVAGGGAAPRAPLSFRLALPLRVTALRVNGADRFEALSAEAGEEPPGMRSWVGPEVKPGDRIDLAYEGSLSEDDVPNVWSEGAILPAEAAWTPSFGDAPALHSITVRAPEAWKVVCPGRPDRAPAGASRFRADAPTRGMTLAAGTWHTSTRARPGMGISVHLRERDEARAQVLLDMTAAAIGRLEPIVGRFPWRRLDLIDSPFASGAPQPGVILIDPEAGEEAMGLAVARQWWGAWVSAPGAAPGWTAGLAEALAVEEGGAAARRRLRLAQRLWLSRRAQGAPSAPAGGSPAGEKDARAALVFAQLRRVVGEDAFFQALRDVGARFGAGIAGWPDLRGSFEQAAGSDLGPFFDQWSERDGLPRVSLGEARVQRQASGWRLTGAIVQAGEPWRLTVPLAITTLAGRSDRDEVVVVQAAAASTPFSFDLSSRPVAVRLDPFIEIPRELLDAEAPRCLGATLASDRLLCVLPAAVFAFPEHPYHAFAQAVVGMRPGTTLASDDELREEDLAGRSLLVLGRPDENRVARRLAESLGPALHVSREGLDVEEGSCAGAECSLLFSARHPLDAGRHVTWFAGLAAAGPARAAQALAETWDTWVLFRDGRPAHRGARPGDDPEAMRILVEPEPGKEDARSTLFSAALAAAREDASSLSAVMEEALGAAGTLPGGARRPFSVARPVSVGAGGRAASIRLHRGGDTMTFEAQAFPFPAPAPHADPADSILVAPEDLAAMGAWPRPAAVPSFLDHVVLSIERPADEGSPALLAGMLEGAHRIGARALILLRAGDGPSSHQALLRDASPDPAAALPLGGPPPPLLVLSAGPELGAEILGRQAFARLATPPDEQPPSPRFSPWLLDLKVGAGAPVRHEEASGMNVVGLAPGSDTRHRAEVVVLMVPLDAAHAVGLEILAAALRQAAAPGRLSRGVLAAAVDPSVGRLPAARALADQLDEAGLSAAAVVVIDVPGTPPPGALLHVTSATPALQLLARGAARETGLPIASWRRRGEPAGLTGPFLAREVPVIEIGVQRGAAAPAKEGAEVPPAGARQGEEEDFTARAVRLVWTLLTILGD